jgi:hypothetical protein
MQPRLPKYSGLGLLIGLLFATSWLLACYWLSQLPVVSDVSLSKAFQPWWRYWFVAAALLVLPVPLPAGIADLWRSPLQYRVRALFVVTTIVAIALGLILISATK